jgi:hypothetical protein
LQLHDFARSGKKVGALVAACLVWLACSRSGPESRAHEAAGARASAHESGAAPGQAQAAPAGAARARSTSLMQFSDAEFAAYVDGFPPLALPVELPLSYEAAAGIEKRPMPPSAHDRYLCGSRYFECKSGQERGTFHHAYRIDISAQAIGLLYQGVSETDVQLVLMTYDASGTIVNGLIVAGDFKGEYGFDGELQADRSIVRNHYVWVDGKEKEYVKDRKFRITESGGIEETIL